MDTEILPTRKLLGTPDFPGCRARLVLYPERMVCIDLDAGEKIIAARLYEFFPRGDGTPRGFEPADMTWVAS